MDIDGTGVTVKFQGQTFKLARYCLWDRMEEADMGEVDWSSASGFMDTWDGALMEDTRKESKRGELSLTEGGEPGVPTLDPARR